MLVSKATGETQLDGTEHRLIFTAKAWETAETMLERSALQIVDDARSSRCGFRELQVLLGVSTDAYRQRNGMLGRPWNPTKMRKVIEEAGGLMPVLSQIVPAMLLSTALGANDATDDEDEDEDDEEDEPTEADPFAGTNGSGNSEQ